MPHRLAHLISVVLHPLGVSFMSVAVFFYYFPTQVLLYLPSKPYFFALIICFTILVPLAFVLWLYRAGKIKSLRMPTKADRPLPLLLATISHSLLTYLLIGSNFVLSVLLWSISITLLLLTLISFRQKISIHAAAHAGMTAFFLSLHLHYSQHDLIYPLTAAVLFCGLVMSARLELNAHKPSEVWSGFFLGFGLNFSILFSALFFFG